MLRKTLAVVTLLVMAGCSGEAGIGPFGSDDPSMKEATQLAAAAASPTITSSG